MAAFAISYEGLTRGNIRHIYSYKTTTTFIPTPRPTGRTSQFLPKPLIQRYPPRFYDYYPAFNMGLPRAPAFNRLTAGEVRGMVERMTKPIACQQERVRSPRSKEHERSRRNKEVKVVRFRSPAQSSTSATESSEVHPHADRGKAEASESADEPSDKVEVKVKVESEEKRVKDGSSVKVKSEKLPKLSEKKQKKQNQHVRPERQSDKLTLPAISN